MNALTGKLHRRLCSTAAQWAGLLSVLAILGLLSAIDFYAEFKHHRELSLAELSNRATFIETSVEHQLETIHLALGNLQAAIANPGKTVARTDLRQRLEGIKDSLHGVRTLAIFDADGTVLISDRPELTGANFAHRDYFSRPSALPDPARLYVSPPFRTVLGVLSINVSRAIVNREGKFAGVVTATLDPAFFANLLQSGRSSQDMYALLTIGGNRSLFLGVPDNAPNWLEDVADQGGIFGNQENERETSGADLPIVTIHGEKRAVAMRWAQTGNMAPDNRIGVLLSRNLSAIEQNGYHGAAIKVGLYGSVVLIGVFGLLLFQRRQRAYRAERAQQQAALRASEGMYRSLFDHMLNGFAYCRMLFEDGRAQDFIYLEVNAAFETQTGLRNVEGKRVSEILPGLRDQDPQVLEIYGRVALSGKPERGEIFVSTINAWLSISVCCPHREHFLVIFDDISERKAALLALEQANAELAARTVQAEEASAAKTQFLSSISHELRTPLHTILGYVRLLLKETEGEAQRQLLIVERSGAQLLKLIDQLLEFNLAARLADEMQPDALELQELVAQLEPTGHLMARERNNRFSLSLGDDLPATVWVDEQRLLQVLQNLLGNACKYTHNGAVILTVTRDEGARRAMDDGMCRLRFTVEDSGAGIAVPDQEHIFEAFNRGALTHGQPGLGLGLAIARQWVRAMGSDLRVDSTPGRGSRFFFTLELPTVTSRPHPALAACEAFKGLLAANPHTVLVVDDIAENRLLLRDLCERWGFTVLEAADGEQALSACITAAPPIDIALIDQLMPGMDGWELLRRIRQTPALEHLPAVLISASAGKKPAGFPAAIEFDLTLGKPLDEQELACFLCQRLMLVDHTLQSCRRAAPIPDTPPRVALAAEELANFRRMLSLGRVVRIEEWAQALAARDAAYRTFAERVVQHCRAADLAALEKLAATALATGPGC